MREFIVINPKDNVGVALHDLAKNTSIQTDSVTLTLCEDIPAGHKFSLVHLKQGDAVIKYGYPIGHATCEVQPASWMHVHNLKTNLKENLEYEYHPVNAKQTASKATEQSYFMGFQREDGRVGIRNEIWIIPTVGCVNSIASALERKYAGKVTGSVDTVAAFPHPYGCSQMGDDQENTRRILADLINHPNAGGVLVLGLGCENSNIEVLKPYLGAFDENRIKFLQCQDVEDEMIVAGELLQELIATAASDVRVKLPASKLRIGMKCGGSDGLSGITANPAVGAFSDLLVAQGGTTVLTEVPEMFGAETILMDRCGNEQLFDKTVSMINDFKCYFTAHNQTIYENPSPGNKKGGISTLEDKSLGCTQKSGNAIVTDVLAYGDVIKTEGLNLLNAPGNDLVAATALAAAGVHMVLFTTGRGTPFASPVPTMKISTNNRLAGKKDNWIDFNCGPLAEEAKLDIIADELFQYVLAVASGEQVKSEREGFHDMAIFKQGVTL